MKLTPRQQRELEYHREASAGVHLLDDPFDYTVAEQPSRRWWNQHWAMYTELRRLAPAGKRVLVVGCGYGDDALLLARLGAHVDAFDLSDDSLAIARRLAAREGATIDFRQMTAERLDYADASFDLILCRDILHHVEIPEAMREIRRVARPGAIFVANEVYSHSWTERVRRSAFVQGWLYPRLKRVIYGDTKPYITADERKMTESDMALVEDAVVVGRRVWFDLAAGRLFPNSLTLLTKFDTLALRVLPGRWLAGRAIVVGRLRAAG
jgi:ubiquinone/menaquinone biosynthesis C-methylase UbiE